MAKDIFAASFNFIEEHVVDIVLVVLVLFLIVTYNVMNNITFSKAQPVLQRVVVMENLENKGVCHGGLQERNKACQQLETKESCNALPSGNCCVWARKKNNDTFSCVGGDMEPTYNAHKYDEWYFKNKLYPLKNKD